MYRVELGVPKLVAYCIHNSEMTKLCILIQHQALFLYNSKNQECKNHNYSICSSQVRCGTDDITGSWSPVMWNHQTHVIAVDLSEIMRQTMGVIHMILPNKANLEFVVPIIECFWLHQIQERSLWIRTISENEAGIDCPSKQVKVKYKVVNNSYT